MPDFFKALVEYKNRDGQRLFRAYLTVPHDKIHETVIEAFNKHLHLSAVYYNLPTPSPSTNIQLLQDDRVRDLWWCTVLD